VLSSAASGASTHALLSPGPGAALQLQALLLVLVRAAHSRVPYCSCLALRPTLLLGTCAGSTRPALLSRSGAAGLQPLLGRTLPFPAHLPLQSIRFLLLPDSLLGDYCIRKVSCCKGIKLKHNETPPKERGLRKDVTTNLSR